MRPLTPEQQRIVTSYLPKIKAWIIDRYPVWTAHRDMVESEALFALTCAVATWQGGTDAERDRYVWKCIVNSRRKDWRSAQKHQHEDYPADGVPSEPDETTRELDDLIGAMPEREAKILDLVRAGFTADEIKDTIGRGRTTTYARIKSAKEMARKLFGEPDKN